MVGERENAREIWREGVREEDKLREKDRQQ